MLTFGLFPPCSFFSEGRLTGFGTDSFDFVAAPGWAAPLGLAPPRGVMRPITAAPPVRAALCPAVGLLWTAFRLVFWYLLFSRELDLIVATVFCQAHGAAWRQRNQLLPARRHGGWLPAHFTGERFNALTPPRRQTVLLRDRAVDATSVWDVGPLVHPRGRQRACPDPTDGRVHPRAERMA
eukprot:scaffold2823_cov373-Prasinococcus_capsulatus_cf.AAC.9